jgi:hypothetical protein
VLLAECQGWDSLVDVPYLFAQAGCVVDVYSGRRSWLSMSRHASAFIEKGEGPRAYIAGLRALAESGKYDWIVFGDDLSARLAATLDDEFFKKLGPICKLENRGMLGSKAGLSFACSRYGIPTPAYAIYDGSREPSALAAEVSFPVLVKVDHSAGGSGVFLCVTAADLAAVFSKLGEEEKKNCVIQKYIKGENVAVEAIFKHGVLVTYAYSIATKTLSGEFGTSSERKYVHRPEAVERIRQIGSTLGLHGFASMTFMYDGEEHYLVEADLRPQVWCLLGRLGGTDFSRGIREFLSDAPVFVPPQFPEGVTERYVRHFSRELLWCLEHRDFLGVWHWLCNTDGRWLAFPRHEPRMFCAAFFRGGRYLARRAWRKLRSSLAFIGINP